MFDIGFGELVLVCIVALLVLGPDRLPEAVRTTSRLLRQLRTGFNHLKAEIEREVGADEIRRDLHNQSIMDQLERGGDGLQGDLNKIRSELKNLEYDIKSDLKPDTNNINNTNNNNNSNNNSDQQA